MTWIRTIGPDEASGELAELYGAIAGARGAVADVHIAQSLHPRAMRAHLDLYKAIVLARSALGRDTRERIAVVVSATNGCTYCVRHHAAALRSLGEPEHRLAALAGACVPDDLPESDRVVLAWARAAATRPAAASEEDVTALRRAGLDDPQILDATLTTAYFCFVNRLVLLLGVDLEQDYERSCGAAEPPGSEHAGRELP